MIDYKAAAVQWLDSERRKSRTKKTYKKGFIGSRMYPHFDAPLNLERNPKELGLLLHKFSSAKKIKRWSFFPFILQHRRMRQFRHNDRAFSPVESRNQKLFTHIKSRPIMAASHYDSCLFSFFGFIFSPYYEQYLEDQLIDESVVAYRSIAGKNNIDFAKKAFDYMGSKEEFGCLLIDIKGFFDNIPHEQLKSALCKVLKVKALDSEVEYVLENLTRYRYVREDAIYAELKKHKRKYLIPIPNTRRAKKICKIEDFNKYINNGRLITTNVTGKGIPQGSPISGLLANISLADLDIAITKKLAPFSIDFYQRYSDDIIVICPTDEIESTYEFVLSELKNLGLKASTKKTEAFIKSGGKITNIVSKVEPKASAERQNIQYLGLEWNGERVVLRPSTIGRRFRPKESNKMKPKFWRYHQSAISKVEDGKAIQKQFYRVRNSIRKNRER